MHITSSPTIIVFHARFFRIPLLTTTMFRLNQTYIVSQFTSSRTAFFLNKLETYLFQFKTPSIWSFGVSSSTWHHTHHSIFVHSNVFVPMTQSSISAFHTTFEHPCSPFSSFFRQYRFQLTQHLPSSYATYFRKGLTSTLFIRILRQYFALQCIRLYNYTKHLYQFKIQTTFGVAV